MSDQEQLSILYQIAQIDASARDLDVELSKLPDELTSLETNVARLQELLAAERNRVTEARALVDKQDEEIRTRAEGLSRAKSKSGKAKNAKEADAVEREIETIRRSIKEREDDKAELQKLVEGLTTSIAGHELEFEELQKISAEEADKIRARMTSLEVERKKVTEGREQLTRQADATILRRYEAVRARKGGIGLAEAVDGTCRGCRLSISAQQFITVQRGDSIEQCPHCQRILFYRPKVAAAVG